MILDPTNWKLIYTKDKGNYTYYINPFGTVINDTGRIRKLTPLNRFKVFFTFRKGKSKAYYCHILVAKAFVPNPEKYKRVRHKDKNVNNNRADNLEWYGKEKKWHVKGRKVSEYHKNLKVNFKTGSEGYTTKLTWEQVDRIRKSVKLIPHINTNILADIYKVTEQSIINIIKNKSWVK